MAGQYPKQNDNCNDLWRKIAGNFYSYAVNFGGTGLNPPNWNDSVVDLERKATYATATAVDIHP